MQRGSTSKGPACVYRSKEKQVHKKYIPSDDTKTALHVCLFVSFLLFVHVSLSFLSLSPFSLTQFCCCCCCCCCSCCTHMKIPVPILILTHTLSLIHHHGRGEKADATHRIGQRGREARVSLQGGDKQGFLGRRPALASVDGGGFQGALQVHLLDCRLQVGAQLFLSDLKDCLIHSYC